MTASTGDLGGGIALFLRRPILAFVLNALILLAGLAAIGGVEIRELPDVDRPVVTVTTYWTGASAETVDQEITGRIEGAAGRVSGIQSISSSSRYGRSRVTMEFKEDVDLDVAAADTRDAIARLARDLPEDADPPQVVKADANADAVMRIAMTSAQRSPQELTQILRDRVEDALVAVPGVADLRIYGDNEAIFRVDVDMMALASRGMSLGTLRAALSYLAFDVPAGDIKGGAQVLGVRSAARLETPEAFEAFPLAPNVTLGDVASVSLGPSTNQTVLRADGQNGVGIAVIRQATSNTLELSAGVRAVVAQLDATLPEDIHIFVTSDDAIFINGSIEEVRKTLILAILIVIAVIYVFLRDLRATLIPAISLPIALMGSLAAIYLVGFSINIITLLALVLATGMVVDDAIVVLENIVRRRGEGIGPRAAALLGTREVFFAVVTTTATLAAVFVPLSFLPGQAGGLFREFGFTLAIAVALSSVVALTLCPVLAARGLGEHTGEETRSAVAWVGGLLARVYMSSLRAVMGVPAAVLAAVVVVALAATTIGLNIKRELTPREDRALVLMRVTAPTGVSLEFTNDKMQQIEDTLAPLRDAGEVTTVFSISGFGASNTGFMVMRLAPWGERSRSQDAIAADVARAVRGVVGVRAFPFQPNSLGIRGAGRGLRFAITGQSYDQLAQVGQDLVDLMGQDPRFGRVSLDYETTLPQLFVDVDRARAADLGVDITGLGTALRAVLDGRSIGAVAIEDQNIDIQLLSTRDPVRAPQDLENIFLRANSGQIVPLSNFVTLTERAVAPELSRENKLRAVEISASLGPEFALGDALDQVRVLAAPLLADINTIMPLSEAAALDQTNNGMMMVFGFALVIVLLVLAAQFESFISAIVVMSTVPLGVAFAIFALAVTGQSLNVYSQIGLVMLIGIMAKNGILIVEFANQQRDRGMNAFDAAMDAARLRLRPVMMTMVSTVFGGIPLILSEGAGAEARSALGWVIVGGLGLATLSTLYVTPVVYALLARFSKPRAVQMQKLAAELQAAEAGS